MILVLLTKLHKLRSNLWAKTIMKYRIYIAVIVLSFFCSFCPVKSSKSTTTRNIEITAEEEKLRDPEGYNSIKSIHAILDDDQSGSIDRYESADFLAEDLKFGEKERERREKTFHENDESITVDDLWEAWFESDERDWDQKQVLDWLVNIVKLPQYASNFQKAEVVGRYLPRMAAQNSTYLNSLGIRSIVHKQKLQLKALDIVLFGLQDSSTILKDIALACLLVILITVLIVFKTHKNRSKKQMEELSTRLSKLRDMETDFEGVQQKLDDENRKRQSMDDDENIDVNQLNELEAERDQRMAADINGGYGLPFNLQNLLRRTFVIESAYLNQQKLECLHEMREAKELVDKMRRKQTSLMNSLKLATGATSGTGDIDTKIFNLKTRMEKIKLAVDELAQRWANIESMCGFSITGPFGIVAAQSLPNLDANHLLAIKYQAEQQHNMALHNYSSMPNSSSFITADSHPQINASILHDNWGNNNHQQNSFEENNHRMQSSSPFNLQSVGQLPKLPPPENNQNNHKCSPPPSELDDATSILSGQSTSTNANPINQKKGNRLKQFFRKKMKS